MHLNSREMQRQLKSATQKLSLHLIRTLKSKVHVRKAQNRGLNVNQIRVIMKVQFEA